MSQKYAIFATDLNMDHSVEVAIKNEVASFKPGAVFFTERFLHLANAKSISKALERLTQKQVIGRAGRGIYFTPEIDPVIGPLTPSMETIAEAIAARDKARIVPTGIYALNRLGLSTQVPMNLVYLTDGAPRKVRIGKRSITFKKTSPKNLAATGPISRLAIQALRAIGEADFTDSEKEKIQTLLLRESPEHLRHDIILAPEWIRKIIRPVLNNITHGN